MKARTETGSMLLTIVHTPKQTTVEVHDVGFLLIVMLMWTVLCTALTFTLALRRS